MGMGVGVGGGGGVVTSDYIKDMDIIIFYKKDA